MGINGLVLGSFGTQCVDSTSVASCTCRTNRFVLPMIHGAGMPYCESTYCKLLTNELSAPQSRHQIGLLRQRYKTNLRSYRSPSPSSSSRSSNKAFFNMLPVVTASVLLSLATLGYSAPVAQQCYNWKNVRIGGGGGFVPSFVFNPGKKGLVYTRTDIGGAYRLNPDDGTEWIPMQEQGVKSANWGDWCVDGLAADGVEVSRVYLLTGCYTNSWYASFDLFILQTLTCL